MTALVRKSLIPLLDAIEASDNPNTGLLIQRGLRVWQESDKQDKKDLIEVITDVKPSELYQLAFDRWLLNTHKKENFASVSATIDGRLMTGLALGGTLETGVTTQHSYGMPILAGSAVKGAVRAYAETLFSQKDADGKIILKKDDKGVERSVIDPAMKPILDILFGTDENAEQSNAGYLIWHDAWLIPALTKEGKYSSAEDAKPFIDEIVTVHHQKYYADKTGTVEALDMESPIPNQQLAIQGSFYFVIEGDAQWVKFAKQILENMLTEFGLGAKGAAGYGYFKNDPVLAERVATHFRVINVAPIDPSDPLQKIRNEIQFLSEADLIDNLSKDIKKFFEKMVLDKDIEEHCCQVTQVVFECHQDIVSAWEGVKGQKNKERAYKFVQKYKA